jgi:hypothetical protein
MATKSNVYKQSYKLGRKIIGDSVPIFPPPTNPTAEDRGYDGCCEPFMVLADINDDVRYKNDVNSAWEFGDLVTFTLKKDGVTVTTPTSNAFPNESNAWYCTIEWRDILTTYGVGCYTLDVLSVVAGVSQTAYTWATYDLMHYQIDDLYMAEGTARILSEFNDVNDCIGINMTDARVLDSLRIKGKFGYIQPNTEVDNVEYLDGKMQKVKREDFDDYELRVSMTGICLIKKLRMHVLSENSCWLSDHNFDSPDYFLFDYPVIVKEGFIPEYFDGSRLQKGVVKFEDKIRKCRTHFQDNRQTAEALASPPVMIIDDITYDVYVNGVFQSSVTLDPTLNHTININA